MGLDLEFSNGQTPIDEDEKEELLIKSISTLGELDEFEQHNVEKAIEWTLKRKLSADKILTEDFVIELHKRMLGHVWKWAGQFRTSNKNLGVDKLEIRVELRKLLDDCKFWIDSQTFSEDEIAVRLSHRIEKIHPFTNGNGRHSRLLADILVSNGFNKQHFTWGSVNLEGPNLAREEYLSALKEADENNYKPLITFARK